MATTYPVYVVGIFVENHKTEYSKTFIPDAFQDIFLSFKVFLINCD